MEGNQNISNVKVQFGDVNDNERPIDLNVRVTLKTSEI